MREVRSVLVALLCMLSQVTGMPEYTCGVDARPHLEGLCGPRLTRARDNLCFLLTADFPEYFGKRSVKDFFNRPVKDFVDMGILADEMTEAPMDQKESKLYNSWSAVRSLSKRIEPMSHIQKRGMVCDCCYNKCLPSVLAQYC
uniref:Insulin-like 1B n=1 Tax=Charonia tritonis TaxID=1960912 RepID=A0A1S6JQ26_9CAEN|nr:insulin-like 1B precursor [Charonia tritonis]